MTTRGTWTTAGLALCAALLVGCGGDDTGPSATSGFATSTGTTGWDTSTGQPGATSGATTGESGVVPGATSGPMGATGGTTGGDFTSTATTVGDAPGATTSGGGGPPTTSGGFDAGAANGTTTGGTSGAGGGNDGATTGSDLDAGWSDPDGGSGAPSDDAGGPDAMTADAGSSTPEGTSFARVHEIFSAHCGPCHTRFGSSGLDLGSEDQAYADLVGVAAEGRDCQGGAPRVTPGDPEESMLIHKLRGGPRLCGSRMPESGPLDEALIAEVESWIAGGALRD